MKPPGLIRREPHEKDKRAHRLELLPTGRRKYESARAQAVALQSEVLSVLDEDKREEFLAHLTLIADSCRKVAEQAPKKAPSKPPQK